MQDLNISLVQPNPKWHKVEENLMYYSAMLSNRELNTDVIVLPEMFTTGFTMESRSMAEEMHGKTHNWMQEQALKFDAVVCGSVIIRDENKYYNRFLWVEADGKTSHYDKKHLFRMAEENKFYAAGNQQVIISYKGWKICPQVCYDLRFPVWSRNTVVENEFAYDILLYVANWPKARISAWDILLKARAVENYTYCIGVNRVGTDENNVAYNGHSGVYGPRGENISWLEESEVINTITIEELPLQKYRHQFPGYLDADKFEIKNL